MTFAIEQHQMPEAVAGVTGSAGINPRDLRHVVSIHYYGRSGSLFLQSLLDGHPQVVMIPGTYLTGYYCFWEIFGRLPALKLLGAFINNYEVLFDARSSVLVTQVGRDAGLALSFDKMGEHHDRVLGIDRDVFMERMLSHVMQECDDPNVECLSRQFFLQAIHAAYAEALGRQTSHKNLLIVLQTHNPYFDQVEPIYQDFGPNIRFLHCLREPVQALGSWYAHMREISTGPSPQGAPPHLELAGAAIARGIDHAKPIFAQYAHHFEHKQPTQDLIAWALEHTRGVRLEDLHTRPRETLENVCAWLGIDWHDSLLQSTFDGITWNYRTTGGTTVNGFQRTTIGKKHADVFTAFDRFRFSLLFADLLRAWNYPIHRIFTWRPLGILAIVLWIVPLRMETSMWRLRSQRSRLSPGEILSSYTVLRLKVIKRWWRDIRTKPPLIQPLD